MGIQVIRLKGVSRVIIESSLEDEIKNKLTSRNYMIPRIYGLPKICEENIPLYPIVNIIGSPTYSLENYLANKFKHLVGRMNSFVKYSTH